MTGWKLTPREATPEMVEAAKLRKDRNGAESLYASVWRPMLQAAAAPPEDVLERMGEAFMARFLEKPRGNHVEAMRAALAAAEEAKHG